MFYGQLTNGLGLLGLSFSGLLAPLWTETTLNAILSFIPYVAPFPTPFASPWCKQALFAVSYIGTMYLGLSSSKEFATYSIFSRLYVFPVLAGVCIQTCGVSSSVMAFALLDIPCALWTKYELSNSPSAAEPDLPDGKKTSNRQ